MKKFQWIKVTRLKDMKECLWLTESDGVTGIAWGFLIPDGNVWHPVVFNKDRSQRFYATDNLSLEDGKSAVEEYMMYHGIMSEGDEVTD